jgi:hypothetical protein
VRVGIATDHAGAPARVRLALVYGWRPRWQSSSAYEMWERSSLISRSQALHLRSV